MLKAESQRMVCLSSPVSLFVLSTKNSKVSCNAGASVVMLGLSCSLSFIKPEQQLREGIEHGKCFPRMCLCFQEFAFQV